MAGQLELTPRGRLCLVLLHLTAGAAWLTGDDNARLAASLLAAPVAVDWIVKRLRTPRLALRIAPRRTHARAPFLETLELENLASRAAHSLVVHEPRTHTLAGSSFVATLGPRERMTVRLAARSRRRGIVTERTFVVDTTHPLGMFRWRTTLTFAAAMVVEPARTAIAPDTVRALESARAENRSGARREPIDYFSLREYRPGDDARHVHAARSARLRTLITKVYRGQIEPEAVIVLDLRRPPGAPPRIDTRELEHHLSVTASLVDAAVARGVKLHCIAISEVVAHHRIDSPASAAEFLAFLATARTVAYHALAEHALAALPQNAACLWIAAGDHRTQRAGNWHLVREAAS